MRLQLFEFEDQTWLPAPLRDAMTRYLASVYRLTPLPSAWAKKIALVMQSAGINQMVDLGSGAGGPALLAIEELRRSGCDVDLILTDLYPNRTSGLERYWPEPVDARAVPPALTGVRTMFAAFHHFSPNEARRVLADAVAQCSPICVFEATARTATTICSAVLIPLFVLLLTPAIRPVSALQLVFTYLIPILPLLIFWDGLVSHLRTYTPDEMIAMSRAFDQHYHWEAGSIPMRGIPGGVPYLIGWPH